VDSEHEVFIQGIEQERKLKVRYFCRKHLREIVSLCAPLHYSKGPVNSAIKAENELECYYLWDFGAEKDSNFLSLSPSEIIHMELTDEVFSSQDFFNLTNRE